MSLFELKRATVAARARTGDKSIGTRAQSGRVQIVRVTFDTAGNSAVYALSEYLPAADAVRALDALHA